MNNYENKDELIRYRIQRAQETLAEAETLFAKKHYHGCVNRLYYSCFYAVSALLLSKDLSSSKHSGIRSLFNQHIINERLMEKEYGELFNDLFEYRRESDYDDFVEFTEDQIIEWMPRVTNFINRILELTT